MLFMLSASSPGSSSARSNSQTNCYRTREAWCSPTHAPLVISDWPQMSNHSQPYWICIRVTSAPDWLSQSIHKAARTSYSIYREEGTEHAHKPPPKVDRYIYTHTYIYIYKYMQSQLVLVNLTCTSLLDLGKRRPCKYQLAAVTDGGRVFGLIVITTQDVITSTLATIRRSAVQTSN